VIPFTFESNPAADLATTNDFVAVPITTADGGLADYLIATSKGPISVNWKNTGDETISVKIMGANSLDVDAADRAEILGATSILSGASLSTANGTIAVAYYQFYWFMHEAAVDDAHGASQIYGRHARA